MGLDLSAHRRPLVAAVRRTDGGEGRNRGPGWRGCHWSRWAVMEVGPSRGSGEGRSGWILAEL